MIDAKRAVLAAKEYIKSLYELPLNGLRLEEVELSDDERSWLITLGFLEDYDTNPAVTALGSALGYKERRVYKQIKVDATTGEAKTMKIPELAAA